jgi:hypothetical protein
MKAVDALCWWLSPDPEVYMSVLGLDMPPEEMLRRLTNGGFTNAAEN